MRASRATWQVLAFDSNRYVGAQIGIHNPAGRRWAQVSHLRNREYVVVAGPRRGRGPYHGAPPGDHVAGAGRSRPGGRGGETGRQQ